MSSISKNMGNLCAFMLAVVLIVAGCGGGGGGSTTVVEPDGPTPEEMLAASQAAAKASADAAKIVSDAAQEALASAMASMEADAETYAMLVTQAEAVMAEYMKAKAASDAAAEATDPEAAAAEAEKAAKAALDAVEADKDSDLASHTRVVDAVARAKAASDKAQAAETVEDAEMYQEMAEAEQANAEKYAGMVTAAKMATDEKAKEAEARAAANKVAGTKEDAIETEGDSTTTLARPFDLAADPAEMTAPTASESYVLSIKHTGSEVEVAVADGELPADNDPQYEQAATFGNGQMLVRNIGTDRKILVVHTDIEAPDQVAFSSEYNLTVDRDTDTTANDTYAVLADDNGKVAGSPFPDKPDQDQDFPEYDADTASGRRGQFSGTFDGASGTFRCVASGGCTVTTDAMGDIEALDAGDWQFTPAAGATVEKPDVDYLTYGFWLDTKTKDGEVTEYETIQTFAMSSLPAATGTLDDVEGTATYDGDAAGAYYHETKNDDGSLDVATSGRFTADVSLTAHFDAITNVRPENSVVGTISNFDLENGEANNWNVKVSAGIGTGFALEDGTASGMMGDDGSLSGQFHHATTPAREDDEAPSVLIGEFNANFVNGSAAGAFGARKQ